MADVLPSRLEKALAVGADAVINSAEEDVIARLIELHGSARTAMGHRRPGTDIYLDAAGVPAVVDTALAAAKHNATLGIVAVHKKPVGVDFGAILGAEVNIVTAMGYPTEIFEVTSEIIGDWEGSRRSSATASRSRTSRRRCGRRRPRGPPTRSSSPSTEPRTVHTPPIGRYRPEVQESNPRCAGQ